MDRRTFLAASTATVAVAGTPLPALGEEAKTLYWIMPDITRREHFTKTGHDNCWTIHYSWMSRWWKNGRLEVAHVNSRRYREWLADYQPKDGIPPHITFGGAIVSGEADPTFHPRWVEYAKATFT